VPYQDFEFPSKRVYQALDRIGIWLQSVAVKKKILLGTCLLFLLVGGYFANYGVRTTRPETLRRLVAQNVKIGDSPQEVMSFLDARHLEHSEIRRTSDYSHLREIYGDVPMIVTIKRRTWRSLLMYESIQIVFVFDDNNRLVKFDLNPVYTGL
jgi:hypothetical protein